MTAPENDDPDYPAIEAAKQAMLYALGDQLGVPVGELDAELVHAAVEAAIREYEAHVADEVLGGRT